MCPVSLAAEAPADHLVKLQLQQCLVELVASVECQSVFLIAFDDVLRRTLAAELCDRFIVNTFKSCEAFFEANVSKGVSCLVVQATTPNAGSLLERTQCGEMRVPVILIGDRTGVAMAVKAMKAGAADYLDVPVRRDVLINSILVAMEQARVAMALDATQCKAAAMMATLTVRQHEILDLILEGHPSKNIASDLGISQRTVENHRAEIMKKTGSRSIPALVVNVIAANHQTARAVTKLRPHTLLQ